MVRDDDKLVLLLLQEASVKEEFPYFAVQLSIPL